MTAWDWRHLDQTVAQLHKTIARLHATVEQLHEFVIWLPKYMMQISDWNSPVHVWQGQYLQNTCNFILFLQNEMWYMKCNGPLRAHNYAFFGLSSKTLKRYHHTLLLLWSITAVRSWWFQNFFRCSPNLNKAGLFAFGIISCSCSCRLKALWSPSWTQDHIAYLLGYGT